MALLDVVLGYDCNLACTYCTIGEGMRARALSTTDVARELDRARARCERRSEPFQTARLRSADSQHDAVAHAAQAEHFAGGGHRGPINDREE